MGGKLAFKRSTRGKHPAQIRNRRRILSTFARFLRIDGKEGVIPIIRTRRGITILSVLDELKKHQTH